MIDENSSWKELQREHRSVKVSEEDFAQVFSNALKLLPTGEAIVQAITDFNRNYYPSAEEAVRNLEYLREGNKND